MWKKDSSVVMSSITCLFSFLSTSLRHSATWKCGKDVWWWCHNWRMKNSFFIVRTGFHHRNVDLLISLSCYTHHFSCNIIFQNASLDLPWELRWYRCILFLTSIPYTKTKWRENRKKGLSKHSQNNAYLISMHIKNYRWRKWSLSKFFISFPAVKRG